MYRHAHACLFKYIDACAYALVMVDSDVTEAAYSSMYYGT